MINNVLNNLLRYFNTKKATAPSCLSATEGLVICKTVRSVCITVTGSTVIDAAVVHRQLQDLKSKQIFGSFERRAIISNRFFVFFKDKLHLCSMALLSVPKHGLAAHAVSLSHFALQCHIDCWRRY